MAHSGGETAGLALALKAHPCDHRPLERVECVTLQNHATSGQYHNDRFVVHGPTLAGLA
jgi:hypothetical protein